MATTPDAISPDLSTTIQAALQGIEAARQARAAGNVRQANPFLEAGKKVVGKSAQFLANSATHYLESISPRGKDLRFYTLGGLTGVAATALVYALPDGPQHLWVIPVTAGVWKGIATTVATGILSYRKYRGYLADVETRAGQVAEAAIDQAEGITAENQAARIEQMAQDIRQLAREKNRARIPLTKDDFERKLLLIADQFVMGEAQPDADGNIPMSNEQIAKTKAVYEAMGEQIRDREQKYALFKSRMASFTGGMAAATLAMNLTNFAVYKFTGEGLGQRVHQAWNSFREGWEQPVEPKAAVPPSATVSSPPAATAVPAPVETPQPALPPAVSEAAAVAPVVTTEPPQQDIMEGATKRAIEAWQQTQQTGNLPHVDKETLARAAEVGSHFAEIDGSANAGIQEALAILKQNGFDNPSEAAIRQIQEKILHLAEDLANSSELPLASDDPAAYKEVYTNLLNAHLDQFQTMARQALIENQPAALEKLTAFHSYSGNFDTLALLQAVHHQGLNLDVTKLSGDTARILGTIYGGLDTVSQSHINYIDPADWSSRLATTLRVGDRSEVEAFVRWVGVPQDQTASVLARLLAGDKAIFDQIVQILGAFTPEKRAAVERLIEAASSNDPDAIKILQAIGHWKKSNVLNIPANIKLLLEYKYGLNR